MFKYIPVVERSEDILFLDGIFKRPYSEKHGTSGTKIRDAIVYVLKELF